MLATTPRPAPRGKVRYQVGEVLARFTWFLQGIHTPSPFDAIGSGLHDASEWHAKAVRL